MNNVISMNQWLYDHEDHVKPLEPNWSIDENDYILWKARQKKDNISVLPIKEAVYGTTL